MTTDPIADLLTRIRNGSAARKGKVEVPASNLKLAIARILKEEGYIKKFRLIKDNKQGVISISLKYDEQKRPVIIGIERVSKPSRRVYVTKDEIPSVLGGFGIAVISSSSGLVTDKEAKAKGVGGEYLLNVW